MTRLANTVKGRIAAQSLKKKLNTAYTEKRQSIAGTVAGKNLVSINGRLIRAAGIDAPAGSTVNLTNNGSPGMAEYTPAGSGVAAVYLGGGGSGSGGGMEIHALDGTYHSGTLADAQAPQFLKYDGSRQLTGNLTVASGITIDGIDISAHAANINAHTAVNEDSLLWMMHAPSETFDVIITDPPYGIGADTFGDSGGAAAGAHFYEDSYENWKALISTLSTSGYRVARPQAHLYCFCDITRFEELKEILTAAGWKCFRTPLIWHKPNGNRVPWVESGPQRRYEIILYAKKGDKPVTRIYGDVLEYRADENLGHPAQKPVALYVDLLRRSCTAGDQVLDPFAGSGPIFPAAQELKLRATGVEKDPAAYGIALARLDKLKIQPELEGLV